MGKGRDERNRIVFIGELKINGEWEERQGLAIPSR